MVEVDVAIASRRLERAREAARARAGRRRSPSQQGSAHGAPSPVLALHPQPIASAFNVEPTIRYCSTGRRARLHATDAYACTVEVARKPWSVRACQPLLCGMAAEPSSASSHALPAGAPAGTFPSCKQFRPGRLVDVDTSRQWMSSGGVLPPRLGLLLGFRLRESSDPCGSS